MPNQIIAFLVCLITVSCTVSAQWPKVYHSNSGKWQSMAEVEQAMKNSQAVFVGEKHNHAWGHKIEEDLLKRFYEIHSKPVLALEMFERDVQHIIDGYMNGDVTEKFFLKNSRPWPNYQKAYRPLIELSGMYQAKVLAMNIPRRYAAMVAKGNEAGFAKFPKLEKGYIAEPIYAPQNGRYYEKFREVMSNHVSKDVIDRYYRAQCIKDDTMADSIVKHLKKNPQARVISYMGSFHCDEDLGVVERVIRAMPEIQTLVISIVPVGSDKIKPQDYKQLGDFIIFAPDNKK